MKILQSLTLKLARASLWPLYFLLAGLRGQSRALAAEPGHPGLRRADRSRDRSLYS